MKLKDCTQYHLRQMWAACHVVAQQYRVVYSYDSKKGDCAFCFSADSVFIKDCIDDACMPCPWYIFGLYGCASNDYGTSYEQSRIHTIEQEWLPQINAEMGRRGL